MTESEEFEMSGSFDGTKAREGSVLLDKNGKKSEWWKESLYLMTADDDAAAEEQIRLMSIDLN